MEKVRLWTLQPADVWDLLKKDGALITEASLLNYREMWPDSFDWMCDQMRARLIGYQGHYPWWAWYSPKPDLRFWRHQMRGSGADGRARFVRMELCLPADRVLLSSSDAWSSVLNHDFVPYTQLDLDRLQAAGSIGPIWPLPEPYRTVVMRSWQRIFDLSGIQEGEPWAGRYVQATFEVLALEDVVSVTPFSGVGGAMAEGE